MNVLSLYSESRVLLPPAPRRMMTRTSPRGTIIAAHGLLGHCRTWNTVLGRIQHSLRADSAERHASGSVTFGVTGLAVDMRNHGHSPHHSVHSCRALSGDLEHSICTTNVGATPDSEGHCAGDNPIVLMGHSMGALAMMYSILKSEEEELKADDGIGRKMSDNVRGLIAIDMPPLVSHPEELAAELEGYLSAMMKVDVKAISSMRKGNELLLEAGITRDDMRMFLLTNVKTNVDPLTKVRTAAWKCNVEVLAREMRNIYLPSDSLRSARGDKSDMETLFIFGEESSLNQKRYTNQVYDHFREHSKTRIERVDRAGHNVHHDNMEAFVALATPFIQRLLG